MSFPLIFTLNTDDCKTDSPNTFILKFLDGTTLLSLLSPTDFLSIQQRYTDRLVEWCENSPLIDNPKKQKKSSLVFQRAHIIYYLLSITQRLTSFSL